MNWIRIKSNAELRKFGITIGIAFAILGALFLWRGKAAWIYLEASAALFLICGLIFPKILQPIEFIWMKFAYYLGIVVTHVLVTLTFFLIITPLGLLLRLLGKDLLQMKFDKKISSYWIPSDPKGPASRPDRPY